MAKGDDIQERLVEFAVDVVHMTAQLLKTTAGKHMAGQLMRSGTSPAPNYAEARSAESTKDFIHKLKVALKELNETRIWFQIIKRSQMLKGIENAGLVSECDELCRIVSASIKTSMRNKQQ